MRGRCEASQELCWSKLPSHLERVARQKVLPQVLPLPACTTTPRVGPAVVGLHQCQVVRIVQRKPPATNKSRVRARERGRDSCMLPFRRICLVAAIQGRLKRGPKAHACRNCEHRAEASKDGTKQNHLANPRVHRQRRQMVAKRRQLLRRRSQCLVGCVLRAGWMVVVVVLRACVLDVRTHTALLPATCAALAPSC